MYGTSFYRANARMWYVLNDNVESTGGGGGGGYYGHDSKKKMAVLENSPFRSID